MNKYLALLKQIFVVFSLIVIFYFESHSQISRYPNEIKSYRIFTNSKLEQLEPLVSTKEDVMNVFDEEYPGKCDWKYIDDNAENGCELDDRRIIVGFVYKDSNSFKKSAWEKLEYVRVIPKIDVFVKESDFNGKYTKGIGGMSHPQTSFYIYYDEDGLNYQVIKNSVDSDLQVGTLFQVKYSYSKKNYKKYAKK